MRVLRKLMIGLAALLALPLVAQGPVPQQPSQQPERSAPPASAAQAERAELDAADVEAWLDGFMPFALDRGQIAGAVVVVVRGDGPVLQKGYGFADVASRKPVDPQTTLFRPGSVSKLFTWTAVMQQVEAGQLDLDEDVNAYLDFEIPPYEGEPITLRHILTHTPGFEESIRHLISSDPDAVMPLQDYAREALPERVFAPGTTPAYSNYATALAGYIVERVSGQPFDDYVERHIFAPLEMRYATFRQPLPEALQPHMSSGYPTVGEKAKPFEIVIPAPAGSLSASGAAMGKFMMAHLNEGGPLLQPETARTMHDYRAPGVGPLNTMALGFYEQWVNGRRAIGHGGDTEWFHSYLWLFPDADIGLFVSVNSAGKEGGAQALRSALFHEFADRYLPGPEPTGRVDPETAREHAAMVAGHYVSSRGAFTNFMSLLGLLGQLEIVVDENGKIAMPALDGLSAAARDWVEVEPFVWVDTATGERLAAEVKDGRVVRVSTDAVSPFMVLEPASAGTNTAWLMPALILALALVLLAALAWPVRALVRRHFQAAFALENDARKAWRLSRIFAWLVLLAVFGWVMLVVTFSGDIGSLGGPLDWLIILLRILTPIATVGLLAASAWHLWLCFRDRRRWTMKVGGALLVLAALVLVWVTFAFNLYGFSMVY
ncbi:serine hydrolase domain-containing protein [Pelagerythrobacter rhizovicinus]|uniref:Class A beta-lactamase-related serine hydrolase n=1 Tax=Pelagerythrobacter rhizovicinus TaxID=2268576 RepID=A0A4Q2KGK2_9SPHN|nr:serine hydrolase domain-containing protein [Pelagerythrobacter rhizovicinus]RXZ64228.1 class A beta-lactamase-related serine hydrolase [Pelagerythrobacter rhizovicinus]